MDAAFAAALDQWRDFYVQIGLFAVTLLGLLFVALSLRLNLFHRAEVMDVRDYAWSTFAKFLTVGLASLLVLMPQPRPFAVGLPLVGAALVLVGPGIVIIREALRLNQGRTEQQLRPLQAIYFGPELAVHLLLLAVAVLLAAARPGAVAWLAPLLMAELLLAAVGARLLLSNAWRMSSP
jgi:hypothetical protein